ncbi:MAG: hypothetical protein CBE00_12740 [Planctomycetaceae bacterium TMED240]|nr:hypothetical protein [Rhodopirellula sp.]OUX04209.1 MAG: hypothetical protein CBE00_12740 [Planctomycetaceae bacterium TMED240]
MTNSDDPRLWFIDDNIVGTGGHFLELASLLAGGARDLGYAPRLAVNQKFNEQHVDLICEPVFSIHRMRRWSLGVDGTSTVKRNTQGTPIASSRLKRVWHQLRNPFSRHNFRPENMLQAWSDGFLKVVRQKKMRPEDRIVVNTGDDFQLLALTRALRQLGSDNPLTVHVILHFALYEGNAVSNAAKLYGEQVNDAISMIGQHKVHLHATTEPLARQLEEVGVHATAIPYPVRPRCDHGNQQGVLKLQQQPLNIVLAGLPRAEKGRGQMKSVLSEMWGSHLQTGNFRMAMQMPEKRWQRMVPLHLRSVFRKAIDNQGQDPENRLVVQSGNLDEESYNRFLDSADVGLFLYNPERYVARCSGVLLELLIRGVPVVVPKGCWLSDQLDLAGGDGSIGYSYTSTKQIPALLHQIRRDYPDLSGMAAQHAKTTLSLHNASNTLRAMGIPSQAVDALRAS